MAAATAPSRAVGGPGRLRRVLDEMGSNRIRDRILDPPPDLIEVLHPKSFAPEIARMQRERRLNLLGAELLGAAVHHRSWILVAGPNAGGVIERAANEEGIRYEVRRG